jgi:S-formylglutathione hydrolase FrmB
MALLHCHFYSDVLGTSTAMDVILPQESQTQIGMEGKVRKKKHPTLYLLHGLSDDCTIWQRRTSIERYVASMGLAVIMPSAGRSWYADMVHGQRYWTFISEELPAIARSFFPLSDQREDNFVAGLSMGGYGAFKLALRMPDKFAAAASLSGALDVRTLVARSERAWEHELMDIFGDLTKLEGSENDLFHLAKLLVKSKSPIPQLYQWCGMEDFLYKDNVHFREHAEKIGLPLTSEESVGNHNWDSWDLQIQRVLKWLPIK